ncbi:ABC transporter permease subunit [Natronococcus sp. A-GB7]|uniref:ABC transporter permease n=1 Tax=Natronococcus sp. A-GB7 TaxID=3037649 RepID=UPI00241CF939|nr:ABC transporter permease subunit [Natronococcus sp. A-GB7]MDG5821124.1 ABC transporter permease subunit [Natronococcus sp. A-GB7]
MEHESAQSASERSPSTSHRLGTVIDRELRTVARTRTFYLLTAALTAVVIGITWIGGGYAAGYLPTAVDLLTPLELLVPIVAVAFGYRAILADEQRGELDVLETYPISPREFVFGVYVGRAAGLVVAISVPLLLAVVAVAITDSDMLSIYATHTGADSPLLFARFFVLTLLFGLVVLAIALAISSLVSTTRSALGLSIVALVVLLVGFDLALVYGLTEGVVGDESLLHSLAVSPLSAYRGLVLETVVTVASGTGPRVASPVASILGLAAWTAGSLAVAVWSVSR